MSAMMRCEGVQEYLAERLAGSLSDSLSRTVYSHVRSHMLSCPECCEELEDLEEIQKLLQTIPVEPCDSDLMRTRFHLLLGSKGTERAHPTPTGPRLRIRPLRVALFSFAAIAAVIAAFLVARKAVKWITVVRAVPPLSAPASRPAPTPVASAVQTGAISGQIRSKDGEPLSKVRVSVAAVPSPGVPSTEISIDANSDGKYRIDNIAAGQYYVLARMADATTYYPGSTNIAGATIVSVQPGAVLEGIDFPGVASAGKSTASAVPIETAEISGAPQVVSVDVTLRLDTGGRLPYWPETSIVFTGTSGTPRVAASCVVGNLFRALVPANESYAVAVSDVAEGYSVQSIVDNRLMDLLHGGVFTAAGRTAAPSRIVVTLSKN